MRKVILLIFIIFLGAGTCNAQIFKKNSSRNAEKGLFGKSLGNKKQTKVKEPRKVVKAKKKQEANEKKLKRDYEKSVKESRKRSIDIQSDEVKARMKQNQKDTAERDKAKKKKIKANTKNAGKKYKNL